MLKTKHIVSAEEKTTFYPAPPIYRVYYTLYNYTLRYTLYIAKTSKLNIYFKIVCLQLLMKYDFVLPCVMTVVCQLSMELVFVDLQRVP